MKIGICTAILAVLSVGAVWHKNATVKNNEMVAIAISTNVAPATMVIDGINPVVDDNK